MDEISLKKQFSQLQEEQQKKFERLKTKQANAKKDTNQEASFGVPDDLNLNLSDVTSSSSIGLNVTLEAANTAMREELRELHDETGRLRKSLAEREYEIKRLNKKLLRNEEEKRMLTGAGISSDSAATKIVDLSKKNRDLTSQVESEKSKNLRLQQKVNELERKCKDTAILTAREDLKVSKTSGVRLSIGDIPLTSTEGMENLQDQLNSALLKTSEYRNQVQALKQDMKIALKILSQETGENHINLQALIATGGQGYRGRAQQVISLQDKVRELEQKLKTDLDLNPKVDKNLMRIKNMERNRKEQNDALKEDLVKLQEQCGEVQRKWDASKARNKVLMSEVKTLKSQLLLKEGDFQSTRDFGQVVGFFRACAIKNLKNVPFQITVLTDKGAHDNELIDTLMKQQEGLQKLLERNTTTQGKVAKNEAVVHKELHDRKQQESAEIKRLKELLIEREARVKELEEQVSNLLVNDTDSLNGDGDHKPLSVFNSSTQMGSNMNSSNNVSDLHRSEDTEPLRQRCVELKALYDASEIERQHLSHIVKTLNSRNEESLKNKEETTSAYHDVKRKCVTLEQQLEALKSSTSADTSRTSRDTARNGQVVELEAQLSIQKDENNALKEALESTLRNKHDDVTMYQEMTQQTKQVFIDALRMFKAQRPVS